MGLLQVSPVAVDVESCRFRYFPGTESRAGLATLEISLARGDERVKLLQQIHIEAAP